MGSAASTSSQDMVMYDNIDPEGHFGVPAPAGEAPAPPAPADAATAPAVLGGTASIPGNVIRAQFYGTDIEGLKDSKVHADVQDVLVGGEKLVVNTALVTIAPDQSEASEELHFNILQEMIRGTPGVNTEYTATTAAFVVPPQPANAVIPPSSYERLVEPALEAVKLQTLARVLEKDGESVGEPALKRQAVERVPELTTNHETGPSASENSDTV